MQEIELNAQLREKKSAKGELSALRKSRMIPAVVYGGGKPPLALVVAEKDLTKTTKSAGANAIIRLKHSRGEDTVILKDLDHHVVTHQPIHADFQRISLKEKIEVKVHVRVLGEAPGVKLYGGILEHSLRELHVRALPTAIPQHIDVDVSRLELNQGISVKDVRVPAGVELLDAQDHLIVNVIQPKVEAAPTPAPEAAAAEPEVIAKGKKEEDGAEGEAKPKAAAAPAAAPEKKKEVPKKE